MTQYVTTLTDGQHQVDDGVCVPQRTYRHRDRDIHVKYVADASGHGQRLAYDEEDDDHYQETTTTSSILVCNDHYQYPRVNTTTTSIFILV